MKRLGNRRHNHLRWWAAAGIVAVSLVFMAAMAPGADTQGAGSDTYRYQPDGKPDPFKPFVTIVKEEKGTGEEKKSAPLSPLERFAVGQFRLTGIIWTGAKKIAIVESPEGKRHLLRRGTSIGINEGKVIEIRPDGVVVLEKMKDISGNTKEERVVLSLKKNGRNP